MINKKNLIGVLLACSAMLSALAGCSIDERTEVPKDLVDVDGREVPADVFVKGMVNLKVTEEMAGRLDIRYNEEGRLLSTGVRSLDDQIEALGIKSIERTFPHAGEFEARTRAAGLHLWYDVYFDEATSLTRAGNSLADIEGVSRMDYRPIAVLVDDGAYDMQVMPLTGTGSSTAVPSSEYGEGLSYFNDPGLAEQWHYYNEGKTSTGLAKAGADINVLPVWKKGIVGDPKVIVAVVDEGVDYDHEDLAWNMWTGTDDEGNTIYGVDYSLSSVNHTIEPGNHGTHVAGTIGAVNNNGKGVCGIAGGDYEKGQPGVRLMSCQIFTANGNGNGGGHKAIKWAADHGAVIAQNSWGYTPYEESGINYVPEVDRDAIDYFVANAGMDANGNQAADSPMAGGVVIFSAGNHQKTYGYPQSYEKCIAVAALRSDYKAASYTNYGSWVDIAAPGGEWGNGNDYIYSTGVVGGDKGAYYYNGGTSMACPHVSGIAALMISEFGGPGFTAEELRSKLLMSVRSVAAYNPGRETELGGGLVDTEMAINGIVKGDLNPVTSVDYEVHSDYVDYTITIPSGISNPTSLYVFYSENQITEENYMSAKLSVFDISTLSAGSEYEATLSTAMFDKTLYFASMILTEDGERTPLSENVKVTTGSNTAPVIEALDGDNLIVKLRAKSTFRFIIKDEDGHRIGYSLSPSDLKYITTEMDEGQDTLKISFNGNTANKGDYELRLTVVDEHGMSGSMTIKYSVVENKAPVLVQNIPAVNLSMNDEPFSFDVAGTYILDLDEDPLTVDIVNVSGDAAEVTAKGSVITCTPKAVGSMTVDITVADPVGKSVVTSFEVNVKAGGKKPAEPSALIFYPNPVSDSLYVKARKDVEGSEGQMTLYSATGSVVMEGMVEIAGSDGTGTAKALDLGGLPAGTYSIKVIYKDQEVNNNIVKL